MAHTDKKTGSHGVMVAYGYAISIVRIRLPVTALRPSGEAGDKFKSCNGATHLVYVVKFQPARL